MNGLLQKEINVYHAGITGVGVCNLCIRTQNIFRIFLSTCTYLKNKNNIHKKKKQRGLKRRVGVG